MLTDLVKDVSQLLKAAKQKNVPKAPVIICLFLYFAYTTSFTVFETIGTPYTQSAFHWDTKQNGIMFMGLGGICIGALFLLQIFLKFFNDRILLIATTALSAAGFAVIFDIRDGYVPIWRFWISVSLCAASYSTSVAICIAVYSKALGDLDQVDPAQ